jgi:hypothetical protein
MLGTDHVDGTAEQRAKAAVADERAKLLRDMAPRLEQLAVPWGRGLRTRSGSHVFVREQWMRLCVDRVGGGSACMR